MPRSTPYHVEYQVFGVIYFEPDRRLCGSDFADLWSATSIFGKHKGPGYFWHEDMVVSATRNRRMVQLGCVEVLKPLLERDSRPIYGGMSRAQPTRKTTDCDFHLVHSSASRSFSYDTLPQFIMGLSGQWFERTGTDKVLSVYKHQLEVADHYSPPYGFIDIAASEDCYSGFAYASCFSGNCRMHRWVEQIKFLYACTKRRDQARGIYWGNYFGPAILQRLGGREQFLARFRKNAVDARKNPTALVWEFTNGVFVSLCLDPLSCKPGPAMSGTAGYNLHSLLLDLGSHGVLCPWAGELDGRPGRGHGL